MVRHRSVMYAALALLLITVACAHTPPNLSPKGTTAWQQHEVQKSLDLIRDIAQDGAKSTPPVVSVNDARVIVEWHQAAITVIHDAAAGWLAAVLSSLTHVKTLLSAAAQQKFGPYIDLAVGVVKGFAS